MTPEGLGKGGATLWAAITEAHELDAVQLVQLEEACRAKDRCDQLDRLLRGDVATWVLVDVDSSGRLSLRIDAALTQANATANVMKQLLAAMRLPDETGKRPQVRAARGAYAPQVAGGKSTPVSSLDRARARRQA